MSSFVIKSFQNGINLRINPDVPFEQVVQEIGDKFQSSRAFFGSSSVALSIEGRILSAEEEELILSTIQNNSDLNVMCIIGKDDAQNHNFIKAIQTLQHKLPTGNYMQVFNGSLKDNAVLEMEESILVIGDVNPGCTVVSGGSIFIFGGLYGEAYAETLVMAMEMAPEELKINDFQYALAKKHQWGIKPKLIPQIAYVSNDKINIEPYTKELLDRIL